MWVLETALAERHNSTCCRCWYFAGHKHSFLTVYPADVCTVQSPSILFWQCIQQMFVLCRPKTFFSDSVSSWCWYCACHKHSFLTVYPVVVCSALATNILFWQCIQQMFVLCSPQIFFLTVYPADICTVQSPDFFSYSVSTGFYCAGHKHSFLTVISSKCWYLLSHKHSFLTVYLIML